MKFKLLLFFGIVIGAVLADSYDNPNDIDRVTTLEIKTASGYSEANIYANGRNQLKVEILVKAVNKNGTVLHFSDETWIFLLRLRFADDDKRLNWMGESGWCWTKYDNDYVQEIPNVHSARTLAKSVAANNNGVKIFFTYLYTDQIGTKRIAVSLDNENGKYITTADNASGAEKSSIRVVAHNPIIYTRDDLKLENIYKKEQTKNWVTGCHHAAYDVWYDTTYISVPYGIRNANVAYDYLDGNEKWIAKYSSYHNDQHMIIVHPFGKAGRELFGFINPGDCQGCRCEYDLTQQVSYNQHPNQICITQLTFSTRDVWFFDDNKGMDRREFGFDSHFEIYDVYGNYGQFSVDATDDHQYVSIKNRN